MNDFVLLGLSIIVFATWTTDRCFFFIPPTKTSKKIIMKIIRVIWVEQCYRRRSLAAIVNCVQDHTVRGLHRYPNARLANDTGSYRPGSGSGISDLVQRQLHYQSCLDPDRSCNAHLRDFGNTQDHIRTADSWNPTMPSEQLVLYWDHHYTGSTSSSDCSSDDCPASVCCEHTTETNTQLSLLGFRYRQKFTQVWERDPRSLWSDHFPDFALFFRSTCDPKPSDQTVVRPLFQTIVRLQRFPDHVFWFAPRHQCATQMVWSEQSRVAHLNLGTKETTNCHDHLALKIVTR